MSTFVPLIIEPMTEHITDFFISIIDQTPTLDMAEAEFKRSLADDAELRSLYREWCHEVGSTEKRGFLDFCEEYVEGQNEVWDSLTDYDE